MVVYRCIEESKEMIDVYENIKEIFQKYSEHKEENAYFTKNQDESLTCVIDYKGHKISARISINEVFLRYRQTRNDDISIAINELIIEKVETEIKNIKLSL